MTRVGVVACILLVAASTRAQAQPACGAKEKAFQCHERAFDLHVGRAVKADRAKAKALYQDACTKGFAPSCNNLAVLATTTKDPGVDPAALWATACKKLDVAACHNARRASKHPDLAVALTLPDVATLDAPRAAALAVAACAAGDVFRCTDAASRAKVAAVLAEECRGASTTQCYDAAIAAADPAAQTALLGLACKARDGKACHALATRRLADGAAPATLVAQWKAACSDDDFAGVTEDRTARNDACARWLAGTKNKRDQLAVATISAKRCEADDDTACGTAIDAFTRAGAHPRAFALDLSRCERDGDESDACRALAARYFLGRGTARSVPKGLEVMSRVCERSTEATCACRPPVTWSTCKTIAQYGATRTELQDLSEAITKTYCAAGENEACYLGARAMESAKDWCYGEGAATLHVTYSKLCTSKFGDSCQRAKSMCKLAQAELIKSRRKCVMGVGDGSFQPPDEYHQVIELCPVGTWNAATKRRMAELEDYRKRLEDGMRIR